MAHGPPITGFSHVDLSVRDREASARWYVEVLGFEVRGEGVNGGAGSRRPCSSTRTVR